MVRIKRAIALFLMTILIAVNATTAYAEEPDELDVAADEAASASSSSTEEEVEKKKEDETVEEGEEAASISAGVQNVANAEGTLEKPAAADDLATQKSLISVDALSKGDSELWENVALDVCFYIRGNCVGANIPQEPFAGSSSMLYSEPIRVDEALSVSWGFTGAQGDGSESDLTDDGFTAANAVTDTLDKLPTADEIKKVIPEFDPEKQYVVWYVVKPAWTFGSNWDVGIHVDGVIRQRKAVEEATEEMSEEMPVEDVMPTEDISQPVQIVFIPLYLDENGNKAEEIEFDGEEHVIGGFDIVVLDEDYLVLEEFVYNCFGKRLNMKVYAEGEDGKTSFEYDGEEYFVNITSAYAKVKDVGTTEIQYYSGDTPIDVNDVQITDSTGKVLSKGPWLFFETIAKPGFVTVKKPVEQKPITIIAGTTVMNDNGKTLTDGSYDIQGSLIKGHKVTKVVINGSQTGVGQCSNNITTVVIENSKGEDVTYLYDITRIAGKLQLVDPGPSEKDSDGSGQSQYTSTDTSNDTVGRYMPNAANTAKKTTTEIINGRVARAKVTHADGSITYINVPFETSYGNDLSDNQPKVLGARRAATDDLNGDMTCRVFIILFLMGVLTLLLRKNDISASAG